MKNNKKIKLERQKEYTLTKLEKQLKSVNYFNFYKIYDGNYVDSFEGKTHLLIIIAHLCIELQDSVDMIEVGTDGLCTHKEK